MNISDAGLDLIKDAEELRLRAYLCPAGVWTIGWGHTRGVKPGDTCTEAEAKQMLRDDIAPVERAVAESVKVPITQGMYDALCSLVFNIGTGAFRKSTLLRLLNESKYQLAAAEFPRWKKSKGKTLSGLVIRRAKERALFEGKA